MFTSHNGNLIIFSQDIATFVSAAIKNSIDNKLKDNEIFKRDEEVMKKELEKLNQEIDNVTNTTVHLQAEYDKLTNKVGHFHKENIIDLRLIQNFDEGVLNLEIQSSMEIETIIIIAQFDFEVLLDEQLYVF